jgi:hypothetical protein
MHGARFGVLQILTTDAVARVRVKWGDRSQAFVSRTCGAVAGRRATLFVPHRYHLSGRHRITVIVGSACGQARATASRGGIVINVRHPVGDRQGALGTTWNSYDPPHPLARSRFRVDQGKRLQSGECSFPGSQLTLAPGGRKAIESRSDAIDLIDCQVLVETGVPPARLLTGSVASAAADRGTSQESGLIPAPLNKADPVYEPQKSPSGVAVAAQHSAGYLLTWWHDPCPFPCVHVNEARNGTDWYWNRQCVVSPVSGWYRLWWRSETGWGLNASNWQNYYACYHAISSSYALYQNDIFCVGQSVWTTYNRSTVSGHFDGNLVGAWNTWVSGAACKSLLGFDYTLVRTLN